MSHTLRTRILTFEDSRRVAPNLAATPDFRVGTDLFQEHARLIDIAILLFFFEKDKPVINDIEVAHRSIVGSRAAYLLALVC